MLPRAQFAQIPGQAARAMQDVIAGSLEKSLGGVLERVGRGAAPAALVPGQRVTGAGQGQVYVSAEKDQRVIRKINVGAVLYG